MLICGMKVRKTKRWEKKVSKESGVGLRGRAPVESRRVGN